MRAVVDYFIRVGDCLSQLLNVVVFFSLNPNESLSGRAFRERIHSMFWSVVYALINTVFFWQHDHCRLAYLADKERAKRMLEQ